jgi:hypothetical protein
MRSALTCMIYGAIILITLLAFATLSVGWHAWNGWMRLIDGRRRVTP